MSISAMKYALDVLDNYVEDPRCETHCVTAIHFLRQAIAEAEKPDLARVGEVGVWGDSQALAQPEQKYATKVLADGTFVTEPLPLYKTPPKREWVGLTDGEIDSLVKNTRWHELIKATEAKLKEKNT